LELGGSPRHRRGGEHAACCGGDGEEPATNSRPLPRKAAVQDREFGCPAVARHHARGRDLGLMRLLHLRDADYQDMREGRNPRG